jgi:hypothetical protein
VCVFYHTTNHHYVTPIEISCSHSWHDTLYIPGAIYHVRSDSPISSESRSTNHDIMIGSTLYGRVPRLFRTQLWLAAVKSASSLPRYRMDCQATWNSFMFDLLREDDALSAMAQKIHITSLYSIQFKSSSIVF